MAALIEVVDGAGDVWSLPVASTIGDFAIVTFRDADDDAANTCIVHLPTGGGIGEGFPDADKAARAAGEVCRLRNDWHLVRQGDVSPNTARRVREIVESFGGFVRTRKSDAARAALSKHRNAYP